MVKPKKELSETRPTVLLFLYSGSAQVFGIVARVRFAPVKIAPVKIAPVKNASVRSAPLRFAPLRFAPSKAALVKSAPNQDHNHPFQTNLRRNRLGQD